MIPSPTPLGLGKLAGVSFRIEEEEDLTLRVRHIQGRNSVSVSGTQLITTRDRLADVNVCIETEEDIAIRPRTLRSKAAGQKQ